MTEKMYYAERWAKKLAPALVLILGMSACQSVPDASPILSPQELTTEGYDTQLLLDCHKQPVEKKTLGQIAIAKLSEPEAFMVGPSDSRQWLAVKVFNAPGSDIILQPNDETAWPQPAPDGISLATFRAHRSHTIHWPRDTYRLTLRMQGSLESAPRLTLGAECGAALK